MPQHNLVAVIGLAILNGMFSPASFRFSRFMASGTRFFFRPSCRRFFSPAPLSFPPLP